MLETSEPTVSADELHATLEQLLADYFRRPCKIVRMDRRPSNYHSSFPIEELDVNLNDGSTLSLVFKNLSEDVLPEVTRRTKPQFVLDPRREIAVYRNILSPENLGTATFYGAVEDPQARRYWLFIERVQGSELYQMGEFVVWQNVARWLARLHARFEPGVGQISRDTNLLRHEEQFYSAWIYRAERFFRSDSSSQDSDPSEQKIARLVKSFDNVIEKLVALPQTFIHGEFYASNVLVQDTPEGLRVCPIDWEMAAVGPGLTDLAALTAGKWSDEQKTSIALAYHSEVNADADWANDPEQFLIAFDYCRLQQAVQWLGWFGRRRPFWQHAQDWMGEAMRLADKLGL
jgi:hypothetical protein